MTSITTIHLRKWLKICLFILISGCIFSACKTTKDNSMAVQAPQKNKKFVINEKSVKEMIEKAEPLIEEVTEMKYKKKMKHEIVQRDVIRDELTQDLIPQIKKLLNITNDDMVKRQAEMTAQITSQSILGKYSLAKKSFYIVPDNVGTVSKFLEVKEDQLEDFVFLLVTHEMVHALDDQHFDLNKLIASRTTVEIAGAFNSLLEGHAVYVTNKIADKLNMSETAKQTSVKSAAGVSGELNRMQQQAYHSIYVKGAEFVEAIIEKKGPSIITAAFNSPPVSSRQIMNPDEYLNPKAVTGIDSVALLKKVAEKLPIEGMGTQSIDIGGMILRTLLISKGIPEGEAGPISNSCINGVMYVASKQVMQTSQNISLFLINFTTNEDAAKFDDISQKIDKSEIDQINAKLNAYYKILKEEDLNLDGYSVARSREYETKTDNKIAKKLSSTAIINNMYIEVGFENMEKLTAKEMREILDLIYSEQLKMKQI
ncbi:MAG: hypothetical protein JW927_09825 [Deltaproteobacteria bacterium]|nr:hypothetical protein [Deltaproteobacteria bacterium]